MQKMTDKYTKEIDTIITQKEKEVSKVWPRHKQFTLRSRTNQQILTSKIETCISRLKQLLSIYIEALHRSEQPVKRRSLAPFEDFKVNYM
jgi:hypothetical protein